MRDGLWTKGLAIIIICLFVGTSVVPSIQGNFSKIAEKDGGYNHQNTASNGVEMNSNGDIVLDFSFEKPVMEKVTINDSTYDEVTMAGLPNSDVPGEPKLSVKPVSVLLPQDHTVKSIDVNVQGKFFMGDGFEIELGGKPVPTSGDIINDSSLSPEVYDEYGQIYPSSYEPNESYPLPLDNSSLFDTSKPFPTTDDTTVGTYSFRGYSILILALYPIHYIKDSGEVYYYDHFTVTIKTTDEKQPCSLFRGLQRDAEAVKEKIVNPQIVQTYTALPEHQRTSSLVDPADSYQYVIITSKKFSPIYVPYTFQDLIDLKMRKGINATLVYVEDITNDSSYWNTTDPMFNDTQAQIRNFIKDAYLNWETDYILLGGDADAYRYCGECIIPVRELTASNERIPSDLYYGCLDGNYNSDEDSLWGEATDGANGTDVDLFAEVYVGRASVDSNEEVSNFVMKTIMYEYSSDRYLDKVLMVGEDLRPGDGGFFKDQIINGSNDSGFITVGIPGDVYNISTLYDRDWPSGWPASELISRINNGIHIINHLGHSGSMNNMKLGISDVENLINDHYCFIYSQGCDAGAFDEDDCMAEAFTTTPHGAFATIHNTRLGWVGESNIFDRQFFDVIYGDNITELGRANQDSKEDLISVGYLARDLIYTITLFGDPEISLKRPLYPDHDVSIKGLLAPSHVLPNQTFLVNATIINFGRYNESDVLVNLTVDGVVEENEMISILNSGNETTLSFNCSLPLGVHKVGIVIQPVSNENITLNNVLFRPVICGPDVAVTDVSIPLPPIYINNTMGIGVTVKNLGENDLSDLNLTLKVDDIIVDNITISTLLGGQDIFQTLEWRPTASKYCAISVCVDPVLNENYTLISNNYFNASVHPVNHTVYVDDDGNKEFTTINDAIHWIGAGDTIFVYNGTYYENILIYKSVKLIGEDKKNTIIDGNGYKTIHIQAYDVSISGFTIQNGYGYQGGIHIDGCWYGYRETITGNIIRNCFYGIYCESSWYDIITNNTISNTTSCGLCLLRSWYTNDYNIITGNNITGTFNMILSGASYNIITGNKISSTDDYSILLETSSNNNIITDNIISNTCGHGVTLDYFCNNNNITGNTISNMNAYGCGIFIQYRCNNTIITENNITSSNTYGIYIDSSGNETIYHNNFINNTYNAREHSVTTNFWDNGYPSGGNYWDDYTGQDNNGDHIGDTPYNIPGGSNKDYYPLMGTYGQPNAKFTYTRQGMNVTFNASSSYDYDGSIVSYDWNLGDGSNGSGYLLSHTYTTVGSYLVVLTVADNEGIRDTTSKIISFNLPPVFSSPNPTNSSTGNPVSFTWSIPINDPEGDHFSWTIQCSNGQTNSGTGATNGTKTLALTSLSYVTTYKVWVNATDSTGSGLFTRRWYTFTTKASQPPVFGTPTPVNGSANNPLSLSWSIPISDPEGDHFSWTIQCSNGQTNSGTGATNGTKTLALSGLAYLTTYKVWVNATDPTGSGLYTRKWYTFTTKGSLPPVFGTPNPTNGSTGNPVSLTWSIPINDPEGDHFSWTIQCSNGQTNSGTGTTNGTKTLALSGLAYLTTYKVWVNATDPGGSGVYTRKWYQFTTKANNPPVFGTPNPTNGSTGKPVSLTWSISINDPEGNSFNWTIQCSNGQSSGANGASNGTKSLVLSGLAYSTTYKVWVNATDPGGSGLYTRRWYMFTTKVNLPPVFGTPTPTNGSTNNPLNLSWSIPINDPEGDTFSWTIQCNNGQTNSATGATNGTKTLALSGLKYSTTYKVWVNSTDPGGSGLYTRKWFTFTTKSNLPPVFGTPTTANGSTSQPLSFSWSIPINDPNGDQFSWTIQCSNGQTSSATGATNGTKTLALSGLAYSTTYKVWVNATDPTGSGLYTRKWYTFTTKGSLPPSPPTITGPAEGKKGVATDYNFTTIDPDGDQVYYFIDWGDQTNSSWIGPYPSGDQITKSHTWSKKGTYTLKAKAKDAYGDESGWGTLTVTMPLSYEPLHIRFFDWLFERFPHAFPILRQLLGY